MIHFKYKVLLSSTYSSVGYFLPKTPSKPNGNKGNQNKIKKFPKYYFLGKIPQSNP